PNAFGPESLATPQQLAWNHIEHWELPRVSDYIDMLNFFGYNLIETEPQHLVVNKNQSAAVQEETARLRDLLVSRIRRNGMRQMMHFPGTLTGDDKRFEHLSNEKSVPYGS